MFREIIIHNFDKPVILRKVDRKRFGPYRWKPNDKPGAGFGFYSGRNGLEMGGSPVRLRLEAVAPTYRGVTAYWADGEGDATLTPVIARLPRGRGFLAGWTMGAGMCGSIDGRVYRDQDDAERDAHIMAERDAEAERERWEANMRQLEEEEASEARGLAMMAGDLDGGY